MTTEKHLVGRCGINETKPQLCKEYPKVDHYVPPECTYTFPSGEREGQCACDVAACCATPREGGEPGGAPLPTLAGGDPCRHLVWVEEERPVEKTASSGALLFDIGGMVKGPL